MISRRAPANWNQAIMELGARICLPRNPECAACPVRSWCRAYASGDVTKYPIRKAKIRRPHRHISAAVIRRSDGRILIAQRLSTGLLPNLWEFPGGKQEKGESLKSCCKREIAEELDIDIEVGRRIAKIDHAYSHYSITLHRKGTPKKIGCQNFRWIHAGGLKAYPFPRANLPVIQMLTGHDSSAA
jgi:A/G-specific adenine glycosylase